MPSIFISCAAIVVLTIGILRGELGFSQYFALKRSQVILENTIAALEEENKNLSQDIKKLKESSRYARKLLRDRYHLTEENEHIVFFSD